MNGKGEITLAPVVVPQVAAPCLPVLLLLWWWWWWYAPSSPPLEDATGLARRTHNMFSSDGSTAQSCVAMSRKMAVDDTTTPGPSKLSLADGDSSLSMGFTGMLLEEEEQDSDCIPRVLVEAIGIEKDGKAKIVRRQSSLRILATFCRMRDLKENSGQ